MALIGTLTSFSPGTLIQSAQVSANFEAIRAAFDNTAVLTDVSRTITAAQTFAADILFSDALYDIGKSGATRPRDGFFSRNLVVGGTANFTGVVTFAAQPVLSAGLGTLSGDLLFTDATYDIGKSGATRPRDGFFSRNMVVGGTLAVTGAITATAGQIIFPATQNASANVNTLDDYEEGTWTPTLGGTATYTSQLGYYTKVGNKVTIQGRLTVNVLGTGSTTAITGLPFTPSAAVAIGQTGEVGSWASLAIAPVSLRAYITMARGVEFIGNTVASANNFTASAIFGNGADIWFSATYLTAT